MPNSCGEAAVHMESGSAPVAIGGSGRLAGSGRERTASGEETETLGKLAACAQDLEYRLLATMKVISPWAASVGGGMA